MTDRFRTWGALAVALGAVALVYSPPAHAEQQTGLREPDVIFVPSQDVVVQAMLDLANVTQDDVVYDLGSGDGKVVIAAARRGARGVGIDINPDRIAEAEANAKAAGVSDRVRFVLGDIFDPAIPISDATVVTLYLLESLNIKLMPRLKGELRPGTRIVSNTFSMGSSWPEEKMIQVEHYPIYFWTVPAR
jgi:SAM-dependent methyltransferase